MSVSGHPYVGRVAAIGMLVAVYFAGTGAVYFAPHHSQVASWWPAAGLAVALIALAPRTWWPVLAIGIIVVVGAANVSGGRPILISTLFGLGNAAEALVAGALLRRGPTGQPQLRSLDDFLRLVWASLLGALTIAVGAGAAVALVDDGSFVESWRSVFTSHAASTLVIVPVALALRQRAARRRRLECAIQSVALVSATFVAFGPSQVLPLAFAPLPFLVWAALRLDVRTVTWQLLGVSVLCTVLTARGYGPFGESLQAGDVSATTAGAMVQLYLLCAALMSLPLTVAVQQRRQLLDEVTAAEKLTSATLDTTACIILVTDMAGTIVRANSATTTLTGFTQDQLLGSPIWAHLVSDDRIEHVKRAFASGDGTGLDLSRETVVPTAGGDALRIVWSNNLVDNELGVPTYAVLTGVDVTSERSTAGLMSHLLQASINTALIGIDPRGRITVFNSGAQQLLGHTAEQMVGTPFLDLLDPDDLATTTARHERPSTFEALTAEIRASGESRARDWTWRGAEGRRPTVSMTLSVATDSLSGQDEFLCVGRDVTDQRHGQQMLVAALEKERTAVERLSKLDAAKNEFVSTVSHELRTPVTSIVGYTEMLREGDIVPPDPAQISMLDTIARNGERLIVICNDLLLLGGLDSGATSWGRERVELNALVEHVQDSMVPLVSGRDLAVTFEIPDRSIHVLGDRDQLERAVVNLMSNAVKFTEDGGRLGCRLEQHPDEAWVVVHDTGIGIPADEQRGLFQKFFRSSTTQERAIQGTGLGLSIVSGIVSSHGGRVEVDSGHLEGTTFTVRLPLAR